MMVSEELSQPMKVMDQATGTVKTARIRQRAFHVETDDDAKALLKEFAEGVEISLAIDKYIFTKKAIEVKVAL